MAARRAAAAVAAAAALACLLLLPACTRAQMETPLKGQGSPGMNTTEVFLSVYLDRLLEVDDTKNYRFTAVLYFYLTWRDPAAYDTVQRSTQAMLSSNYSCAKPCTDWAGNLSCCDGIYIPTFFFRNAHSFPQDRATGYKMYAVPPPNGSVLWTQFVHGVFYQPMDLRHFPFDSFDLMVALEFLDTSMRPHPGLTVLPSSGGPKLYTYGKGDAVSQWRVDGLTIDVMPPVDSVAWFKTYSQLPSNPGDPLGLTTTNSAQLRGSPPGATSTQAANNVTMVAVKIRITRFWRYETLNTVLPVLLLGLLSFLVFFMERKELATRLGVIVTLFLAMAAIQFVIQEHQPASSYILPTQQLVVATYVLLVLVEIESILVYHVETWKANAEKAARRRRARDRFLAARKAAKAAHAPASPDNSLRRRCSRWLPWRSCLPCLPTRQPPAGKPAAGDGPGAAPPAGPAGSDGERSMGAGSAGGASSLSRSAASDKGGSDKRAAAARVATRRLVRVDSLADDSDFDEYVAWLIDWVALCVLFVGYVVTAVLIFTLSSGYINLFA
ncbi:hypothetical protein ABPG75_007210 [Micractinium tetrahymenae]